MRHWQETQLLFEETAALRTVGRGGALAVIVGLEGSAYRSPGAKLLVRDDGTMIGNVSGGCLENDVRENALAVIRDGKPRLLHYDTSGNEDVVWGLGVGCNGKVDILVQSIRSPGLASVIDEIRARTAGDDTFCISVSLVPADMGVFRLVPPGSLQERGVFAETLEAPPRVVVCGAGDDAMPLVRLATTCGFRVTVADHRGAFLTRDRFPDAVELLKGRAEEVAFAFPLDRRVLAVVKLHILEHDSAWLKRFAASEVRYIGLLGSRARREELSAALDPAARARVFGPVGLDLGAEGPEQVALSVVAELMAVWSGREPRHLRDRVKPIHVTA